MPRAWPRTLLKQLPAPREPNFRCSASHRARPLNGVWATAPYLHNGSVPSLYWMLKPQSERPRSFCQGARDFDPEQVGFRVDPGGGELVQNRRDAVLDER